MRNSMTLPVALGLCAFVVGCRNLGSEGSPEAGGSAMDLPTVYRLNEDAFQMGRQTEFPASVSDGFHQGWFVRWLTAEESERLPAQDLYEKYKDTPSNIEEGRTPYLVGAIVGRPCEADGRGSFRIRDWSILGAVMQISVEFTNIINPMTSYAGGYGYFAIDVGGLRPAVHAINVEFTEQWAYEMMSEEGDPADYGHPVESRRLKDFRVDLEAAFAAEAEYTSEMSEPREVINSYPQSDVVWRWECARNWRGVELLHGKLVYEVGGFVKNSRNYHRGRLGGLTRETTNWSYPTAGDNWVYCQINEAGRYVDGSRHGEWIGTYSNGSGCYRRTYRAGQLVSGKSWYPDGRKLSETRSEGEVVTSWYFSPDGSRSDEVSYVGTKKHGFQRMWWDNGQLQEERQYDQGRPTDVWRRWDRDGKLIQEETDPQPGFPGKSD